MKTIATMIALALVPAASALAADTAKKTDMAKPDAVSINGAEIKWGETPPDLPKGAEMAVLHGDPSKKAPFTPRLKMPAGYKIPPHWHTKDEQLTILSAPSSCTWATRWTRRGPPSGFSTIKAPKSNRQRSVDLTPVGHSSISMTERYAHLAASHTAAYMPLLSAAAPSRPSPSAPPPPSTPPPASGPQAGPDTLPSRN